MSIKDEFYFRRIGMTVLLEQHISLDNQLVNKDEEFVGIICKETDSKKIIQDAIATSTFLCDRTHGVAPEVEIIGETKNAFPYVPSHLYYIMLELLKNSMRSTIERHGIEEKLPKITVIITDNSDHEDISFKVIDEGTGIPRSSMKKIWSYVYSTAKIDPNETNEIDDQKQILAGFGYGLPVSKCYAQYFGGDLQIMSIEGQGTDACLYLNRLGESESPLE